MAKLVKVVVINSFSYTGTTWVNTVLGSHKRALALGPPDRVVDKHAQGLSTPCKVHGEDCLFWPEFHKAYDPKRNFFIQLSDYSGKDVMVINNPIPQGLGQHVRHADIEIKQIQLVRDGRAIAASYVRHQPHTDFLGAVTDFLYPSLRHFRFDQDNTEFLSIRYEDLMAAKEEWLARLGTFIGLDYDQSAFRFWEHEHHLVSGNAGFVALIKLGQGLPVSDFRDREFYEQQFENMQRSGQAQFEDARWHEELSRQNLFVFDVLCGVDNERFGYTRDHFSLREVESFSREFREGLTGIPLPQNIVDEISQRILSQSGAQIFTGDETGTVSSDAPPPLKAQLKLMWLWRYGVTIPPQELMGVARFMRGNGLRMTVSHIRKAVALGVAGLLVIVVATALITWLVMR